MRPLAYSLRFAGEHGKTGGGAQHGELLGFIASVSSDFGVKRLSAAECRWFSPFLVWLDPLEVEIRPSKPSTLAASGSVACRSSLPAGIW